MFQIMVSDDIQEQELLSENINLLTKENDGMLAEYESLLFSGEETEIFARLKGYLAEMREVRADVIELSMANQDEEAYSLWKERGTQLFNELEKEVKSLTDINVEFINSLNEENKANTERIIMLAIFILVGLLIVKAVLGTFIIRSITKPLKEVQVAMKKVEEGDLRANIAYESKDEIGQLAKTYKGMVNGLRQVVNSIKESTETLSANSEELSASAEQSTHAANQVAESALTVSESAKKQSKQLEEVKESMTQMAEGLRQVSYSAEQMNTTSEAAKKAVTDGGTTVNTMVKQMGEVRSSVQETASIIEKLGDKSNEIDQVTTLITELSNQTNLLALNAAIEAARAGEHGKSFAVVAGEVRKLAEQSKESADKIAGMIKDIQKETAAAILAMKDGEGKVQEGIKSTDQIKEVFGTIQSTIAEVTDQVSSVSASVQQMTAVSEDVSSSSDAVKKLADEGAASSQDSAGAAEEQLATAEEIAAAAQSLTTIAMDLKTSVQRFTV